MQHAFSNAPNLFARLGLIGLETIAPVILASLSTQSPLLLIGTHGSGKSLLLERIADALGLSWRHYNASLVNFDDLVGYPLPDERGNLRFLETPASIWGAQAVFIDEIARARPDIQNRLFPVIHERRVQGIALEALQHRWAAMNPPAVDEDDSPYAGNHALDAALADRFAFHVRMPDWRSFSEEAQERVIQAHNNPPDLQAGSALTSVVAAARDHLILVEAQWARAIARYVRMLCALLDETGHLPSARRAGMVARNIAAVHAVCLTSDRHAELGDSAWIAVLSSMPFAASGMPLDDAKLLACHKEAWRLAAVAPDDPLSRILIERDPVRRVQLAVAATVLPEGELTTIITDALAALPEGSRHALAEWLFESHAVTRLSVVAADEAAKAYREVACLQEVSESVTPGSTLHKIWKAIQVRVGRLDPNAADAERSANLLTALFASRRLADADDVDQVLDVFAMTRRQLARGLA